MARSRADAFERLASFKRRAAPHHLLTNLKYPRANAIYEHEDACSSPDKGVTLPQPRRSTWKGWY